jgi:hypothetical protein
MAYVFLSVFFFSTHAEGPVFHCHARIAQLGVMGQNLALNIASKGFDIAVFNRSYVRTEVAYPTRKLHAALVRRTHPSGARDVCLGCREEGAGGKA